MPFLHAHRRRVSAQDIYRSVVVGMATETAVLAMKDRLAFAARFVNGSASRTGLRGIGRIDGDQVAAALLQFITKDGGKAAPSLVEDAPIKSGLLAHIEPRAFYGALRARRHVDDAEMFHDHNAKATRDAVASLVVPVSANARAFCRKPGTAQYRFAPTIRSLLSPRYHALRATITPVNGIHTGRHTERLPRREHEGCGHTSINANGWSVTLRVGPIGLAGKCDVPPKCIKGNGRILYLAADRASHPKLHPAGFKQTNCSPFGIDDPNGHLTAFETKGVVQTLLAWGWISSATGEEVGKCPIEVSQGLLFAYARNGRYPVNLRAEHRQLATLLGEVQRDASVGVCVSVFLSLLQGEIIDEPADASELPEQRFLLGSWVQLVLEAAMNKYGVGLVSVASDRGQERADDLARSGAFAFCTPALPKRQAHKQGAF